MQPRDCLAVAASTSFGMSEWNAGLGILLPQTLLGPSANQDSCEGITYGVEARVSAVLTLARRLRERLRLAARAVVGFR